jgi:hypothetical protein
MPDSEDKAALKTRILDEVRAAVSEGRELSQDEFLEIFRRQVARLGVTLPSAAELNALIAPYKEDVDRMLADTAAAFPDGMKNPAFGDELRRRLKALMDARLGKLDGPSV